MITLKVSKAKNRSGRVSGIPDRFFYEQREANFIAGGERSMLRYRIRALLVSICFLFLFVGGLFANCISPSELADYASQQSSPVITVNSTGNSFGFAYKFSTELQNGITKKTILWNIGNISYQNNDSDFYVAPAILKNHFDISDELNTETFYLPEPITILFLVIGMFLLFRKRK